MKTTERTASPTITRREIVRRWRAERDDPAPFYEALAARSMANFPFELRDRRVLDLGSGPGYFSRVLADAGATVIAAEQEAGELPADAVAVARANAEQLPFASASFDGVFCSNMLEHTPHPGRVLGEIARVLRPGAWAWVSWTNWYSPWGGHAITPFHYLGPSLGLSVYRALFGEPRGKNIPFRNLWPTSIGQMIAATRACPELRLLDVRPRYYQSQRWITRVPLLREVATWNCLLLIERRRPSIG